MELSAVRAGRRPSHVRTPLRAQVGMPGARLAVSHFIFETRRGQKGGNCRQRLEVLPWHLSTVGTTCKSWSQHWSPTQRSSGPMLSAMLLTESVWTRGRHTPPALSSPRCGTVAPSRTAQCTLERIPHLIPTIHPVTTIVILILWLWTQAQRASGSLEGGFGM